MSATIITDAARRRIRNAGQDGYHRSPHRFESPDLATQDGFISAYALALRDVRHLIADGDPKLVAEIDLLARESGIDLGEKP